MVRQQLEQHAHRYDRQDAQQHFLRVVRQADGELLRHVTRRDDRRDLHGGIDRIARMVEDAEQQHHQDRPDAAQRDQTEAVVIVPLRGAQRRHADAQRHDKRHGDRPRRDAAGVKRDGEKILRGKQRQRKQQRVRDQQTLCQRRAIEDAQHGQRQKDAYADGDCPDQDVVGDGRDLICQHLQIRLCDGDDRTERKRHEHDQNDLFTFCQRLADTLAERGHGHFGAELEKTHAEDQQHGAGQKQRQRADLHRDERDAQHQHDQRDRQDAGERFLYFFFQLFIHTVAVVLLSRGDSGSLHDRIAVRQARLRMAMNSSPVMVSFS